MNSVNSAADRLAQDEAARDDSRARTWVALIGFAVAMIDGYDTLVLSFISPLIAKDWHLPASTDRFGRKSLLLISMLIAGSLTLL